METHKVSFRSMFDIQLELEGLIRYLEEAEWVGEHRYMASGFELDRILEIEQVRWNRLRGGSEAVQIDLDNPTTCKSQVLQLDENDLEYAQHV